MSSLTLKNFREDIDNLEDCSSPRPFNGINLGILEVQILLRMTCQKYFESMDISDSISIK